MKKNTVILDIDGVLADYRLGLLYWIKIHYPELARTCDYHMSRNDTWINYETMKVSPIKWLGVLENFRMSGGKQSIPLIPGADNLVQRLHSYGYKLILVTSRPIDIYPGIYRDTVEWLRGYNLHYDLLLWSKNKVELLYRLKFIPEIIFAVDDKVSHILNYSNVGITTFWLNHYEHTHDPIEHCIVIHSLNEIDEEISKVPLCNLETKIDNLEAETCKASKLLFKEGGSVQ